MNISDELKKLHELHQSGALTSAEFESAKKKILGSDENKTSSDSVFNSSNEFSSNSSSNGGSSQDGIYQLNRLRRSRSDRWLGGICGGLAKFTGLESWIWRVIFAIFLCFGVGFLAYILAWIFIPEEN